MYLFLLFAGIGLLMVVLGAIIRFKRAWQLINGINTSTPERRAKMDLDAICIWAGTAIMLGGALFIIGGALSWLVGEIVFAGVIPLFLIIILGAVFYIRRFDGNNYNEDGTLKKGKTVLVSLAIFIPLVVLAVFLVIGFRGPDISIEGDSLVISGMFGTTLSRNEIAEVSLVNEIPALTRIAGMSSTNQLSGRVRSPAGSGRAYIYRTPPYIHIILHGDSGFMYLNFNHPDETRALFHQIQSWRG
jgi:hypothetical protein